jgi:hypothetical protein
VSFRALSAVIKLSSLPLVQYKLYSGISITLARRNGNYTRLKLTGRRTGISEEYEDQNVDTSTIYIDTLTKTSH